MKKILLPLIFALIAGAFLLYPKAPEVQGVKWLELPNLTKSNAKIKAEVKFNNPNFFSLTLKDHDIDVIIADKKIGDISQSESRLVPMRSDFTIPVELGFEREEIFGRGNFLKNITNAAKAFMDNDLTIHYKGTVDVEVLGIGIPVSVDYSQPIAGIKLGNEEAE